MCKLITIKCDESEARGARGVGPLIGRAVRDARAREGGRARRTALLYASAARHSQSAFNRRRGNTLSTPSSETKFWSALRPPISASAGGRVCGEESRHLRAAPQEFARRDVSRILALSLTDRRLTADSREPGPSKFNAELLIASRLAHVLFIVE
ncbi:hypothetical protein EVAR_6208_1 [Eumeta japonica]|uniref:Uncharacterized protein n=1 Tax=Eumeta variegata TaxID=151549 RepID=A0A4C1Z1E6_EUMVA|nr:hypothetical protein EVAR_6208_1 [Eumeta japonica]